METKFLEDKIFLENLDENLKQSLIKYTGSSTEINSIIRGLRPMTPEYEKIINNMDKIFQMVEPLKTPLTLYRGISDKDQIEKGDDAFISTSYQIDQAETYMQDDCCLIIFNVPVGSRIIFVETVSRHRNEREVILNRGAAFSITAINLKVSPNKIHVSYIPSKAVTSHNLSKIVDKASEEAMIINRIINLISKEELELELEIYSDDEEALYNYINDMYKKLYLEMFKKQENIKKENIKIICKKILES
jgi:hypothetical protein